MTVLITLTLAGTDTGPFNIYSNVDSYVTPIITGVAKTALVSGYSAAGIPDAATTVRVKSTSVSCTNQIDLAITGFPGETTTTTTSTTTTTVPVTSTTTTTVTTQYTWTSISYGVDPYSAQVACDIYDLGSPLTTMFALFGSLPIGVGDNLYQTASIGNPALPGFYARSCNSGDLPLTGNCVYQVTGFQGLITAVYSCSAPPTTSTTTTPIPPPTYVPLDANAIGYNETNAPNTGICCIQKILYVNGAGQFLSYVNPPVPVPTGYTRVTQFWVDDNGVPYFDNASVMYVNMALTIPAPLGFYGGAVNGYREISGTAGLFVPGTSSCEAVDCP